MIRKWLASLRERAERRGIALRPMTRGEDGGYAGFSLSWNADASRQLRGLIAEISDPRGTARMFVENERDLIQREHAQGRFYEREELDLIARHFSGGSYVDVGANVGNHAVYAGAFLGAETLHLFEPLPAAHRLLEVNVALNDLAARTRLHRVALSDAEGEAGMAMMTNNLGAARIDPQTKGDSVRLARGDDILAGEPVDFIKIDVEGHEIAALRGLKNVLGGQRPILFVEVEDENRAAFSALMQSHAYSEAEVIQRYHGRANILCLPDEHT